MQYCYLKFGLQTTVDMLDEIKNLGFLYATRAGISIGIDDMVVPQDKPKLVGNAEKDVMEVQQQYQDGAITHGERYNKIIEIWSKVTETRLRRDVQDDGGGRPYRPLPQPDLHHGRFRRARIETADPPALRYARIDGQAVGRDHRDAHHGELP